MKGDVTFLRLGGKGKSHIFIKSKGKRVGGRREFSVLKSEEDGPHHGMKIAIFDGVEGAKGEGKAQIIRVEGGPCSPPLLRPSTVCVFGGFSARVNALGGR